MADRVHWICGKVSPEAYTTARCPPRFKWARLGVVPSVGGETFRIYVGALVDALTPSDALARFKAVYPGAEVDFCSPKPDGFKPAGFMQWQTSDW